MNNHWEFSHLPFEGDLADEKIVCQNCGWSWKVSEGGNDLYNCHRCGFDNTKFYLNNSNFEGKVDANTIASGVSSLASLGGSIAQAKASKQMSKTDTDKEIYTRCGKDKSKSWSKKKKSEYLTCKQNVLATLDSEKLASKQEKEKAQELLQKQSLEREKSRKTQTYVVIGVIAVILGFVIYKKLNK